MDNQKISFSPARLLEEINAHLVIMGGVSRNNLGSTTVSELLEQCSKNNIIISVSFDKHPSE